MLDEVEAPWPSRHDGCVRRTALTVATLLMACCATHHDASERDAGAYELDAAADAGVDVVAAVDAWDQELRRALCFRLLECEPFTRSESLFIQESCVTGFGLVSRATIRAIHAGRLRFDLDAATECLRQVGEGHGCLAPRTVDVCAGAWRGTSLPGAPCDPIPNPCTAGAYCDTDTCSCEPLHLVGSHCAADVCERGAYCQIPDGELSGTCVPRPSFCERDEDCATGEYCFIGMCTRRAGRGEPCATHERSCEGDLVCSESGCVPISTAGGPCQWAAECPPEAPNCAIEPDGAVGRCTGKSASVGAPCLVHEPLMFLTIATHGPSCGGDLRCVPDATSFGIPWREEGVSLNWPGTCQRIVDYGEACRDLATCPVPGRCQDGRCVRVALPGERCGAEVVCPGGHTCVARRCEPRPLEGEPCDDSRRCLEGVCSSGACTRVPGPAGTECADRDDCQPGFTCIHTEWTRTCQPTCAR